MHNWQGWHTYFKKEVKVMDQIATLVATLGFPIVCAGAMAYFIWHLWKRNTEQNEARENKYIEIIQSQTVIFNVQAEQLKAIADTQERILDRLEKLEHKEV